jgi:hypothetical protein
MSICSRAECQWSVLGAWPHYLGLFFSRTLEDPGQIAGSTTLPLHFVMLMLVLAAARNMWGLHQVIALSSAVEENDLSAIEAALAAVEMRFWNLCGDSEVRKLLLCSISNREYDTINEIDTGEITTLLAYVNRGTLDSCRVVLSVGLRCERNQFIRVASSTLLLSMMLAIDLTFFCPNCGYGMKHTEAFSRTSPCR